MPYISGAAFLWKEIGTLALGNWMLRNGTTPRVLVKRIMPEGELNPSEQIMTWFGTYLRT